MNLPRISSTRMSSLRAAAAIFVSLFKGSQSKIDTDIVENAQAYDWPCFREQRAKVVQRKLSQQMWLVRREQALLRFLIW